eukprot:g27246.t1
MASSDVVAQLYEAAAKLKSDGAKAEDSYTFLVLSVTSEDAKARQLVADMLPEYFKLFPSMSEKALNAQLDLCEDGELQIRCHAVRGLFHIGQANATYIPRIADVLAQLLLAEEGPELKAVRETLKKTFALSPKSCFAVMLQHVNDSEEALRIRAFDFFQAQLTEMLGTIKGDKEFQAELVAGIKKVMINQRGLSEAQFNTFELNLRKMPTLKENFDAEMKEIIDAQVVLPEKFDPTNTVAITSLCNVLKRQGKYLQPLEGSKFLDFFFVQVLPHLQQIPEAQRLILLRAVVDARQGISPSAARLAFPTVHQAFIDQVPTKDALAEAAAAAKTTETKTEAPAEKGKEAAAKPATTLNKIKINFSFVECLLFLLHTLGRLAPDALRTECGVFKPTGQPGEVMTDELKAKREALLERLKALEQGCGEKGFEVPIKKFDELSKSIASRLKSAVGDEKKELENKLSFVRVSKASVENLRVLTKGLAQKEPSLQDPAPSWRRGGGRDRKKGPGKGPQKAPQKGQQNQGNQQQQNQQGGKKRRFGRGGKGGQQMYQPPTKRAKGEPGPAAALANRGGNRGGRGGRASVVAEVEVAASLAAGEVEAGRTRKGRVAAISSCMCHLNVDVNLSKEKIRFRSRVLFTLQHYLYQPTTFESEDLFDVRAARVVCGTATARMR